MTVVTGVSGSGKSTLVGKILYPALARNYDQTAEAPGTHSGIGGDLSRLQAVEFIDQGPIGKSTRSNPATYLKAFDEIRQLFAHQQLSKQMGYNSSFFSFNSPGGRCEECKGEGTITIEMQFMADITLTCEACHGKRFGRNALDVTYRDKTISDILDMTVNQAIEFFNESNTFNEHKIVRRLKPLQDVGLGYIKLGQSSSTLSGGENQRVKLAYYLSGERQGNTLFIDTVNGPVGLRSDTILYVEVMAHYLIYHTADAEYKVRASMKEHEDALKGYHFARCHKSYLINLKHLKSINASEAVVGEYSIPLGRAYKDSLLTDYMSYLHR